jgi:hypothetical protein
MLEQVKSSLGNPAITKMLARARKGRAIVLTYHDISRNNSFSSWLRVKAGEFESQIEELGKIGRFIQPDKLFNRGALREDQLNILLTFDDGYANHCNIAMPILEKYRVPALFFLSTENILSGQPFWFDKIIAPVQIQKLTHLGLEHLGLLKYKFSLPDGAGRWCDLEKLLTDIKKKGSLTQPEGQAIIEYFDQKFDSITHSILSECRPLSRDQILQMHACKWCHFGSHADRHEILTYLSPEAIGESLRTSKEFLEGLLAMPVTHFAYPNGSLNSTVKRLCREAEYEYAYTISAGMVDAGTDRLAIPRISVSGYDTVRSLFFKINRVLLSL